MSYCVEADGAWDSSHFSRAQVCQLWCWLGGLLVPLRLAISCFETGASWEGHWCRQRSVATFARLGAVLVGTTKWSAVDCSLCWAWRHLGEATLWTEADCYLCQAWEPLVGTMMQAELPQLKLQLSCSCITGQDWLLLMPNLEPTGGSYNASWDWLLLVLGLEPLGRSYGSH